jgi:hypothetical protein
VTELDLEAIRKRVDAATPGPWSRAGVGSIRGAPRQGFRPTTGKAMTIRLEVASIPTHNLNRSEDRTFIAHSRTDVPALLDRVRALEAELMQAHLELARLRVKPLVDAAREAENVTSKHLDFRMR